jgi:electron transport complex protein RnfD
MPEEKKQVSTKPAAAPEKTQEREEKAIALKPLRFSAAPHLRDADNIPKIMWDVVIATLPAVLAGVYFFGFYAVKVLLITTVSALFFDWAGMKMFGNRGSIFDGSAVVTGILLAMNLPSSSPWWLCVIGGGIAMILGKQCFGGLGNNPFNPALVSRIALLIAWPSAMTTFYKAGNIFGQVTAVTEPTPMGVMKVEMVSNGTVVAAKGISILDMFVGNIGGSLGEVSGLALVIGGIYLLLRKRITWHVPFVYVSTVFLMTGLFYLINPDKYISPVFHVVGGGLLLGAIFMATDMVTTPVTKSGMVIFGIGCGIITVIIRLFGSYPEGVSFSILFMNALTPLIDKMTVPKPFGAIKEVANG